MSAKAKNGHANIWDLFKLNFIATYDIRSPKQISEKKKWFSVLSRFEKERFRIASTR
jgi:hypothetical protein